MTFATDTSAVLDAYTSILSRDDTDGELAELYFTNTGFGLLAVSLASSVAMNLLLPDLALNMIVAGTFAMTWVASLAVAHAKYTLPLMWYRYEVALSTTYISILTSHIVISKLKALNSISSGPAEINRTVNMNRAASYLKIQKYSLCYERKVKVAT